jgi:naphthoate synthase/2-ketocyclohexanecarboxyl-CoA hydrolase
MSWSNWERVAGLEFDEIIYDKKFHAELEGGVARISINRPKYNAMTSHTADEMFRAFYDAGHDTMIGAIVVRGMGGHFGAGGDVEWEQWGLREAFYWRHPPNRLLRLSPKPVIAAVEGYCIGGSNHLAYCCDFTIAADTAIFGQAGPRVSSPADGSFVPYLTHVVGAKRAREMWMLCRRYTADQALAMGLVNSVVPAERLEDEVDRWCEELLAVSPGCVEILKAAFDQQIDAYADMGVISHSLYPDWFDSPEAKEGPAAFLDKRRPRFWRIRREQREQREPKGDDAAGGA